MPDQIKKISKIKTHKMTNFIQEIRYPFYKKLQLNSTLTFDSAFTALVGPNGSGKSSVLTSLYGAVRGNSLGDFWFSTELDPIQNDESGGSARIIYKYIPDGMEEQVEVIKLRIRSARTGQRENPDYWETAKPRVSDGMEKMPDNSPEEHEVHRNATRWKAVNKDVIYIDFRSELCAFDIAFYFKDMDICKYYTHVQDFLRDRSRSLKNKLSRPSSLPTSWHSQHIGQVEILTDHQLYWANKILGKHYVSAKRVLHTMFEDKGYSIFFNDGSNEYTEAAAGSGEVAVINCVCKVLSAPTNALILLDEPEVSLHPGAQNELRNLLFEAIIKKNAQVVVSTHSEHFLKNLPNNAIKLFQQDVSGRYSISNQCSPEQAFSRLGGISDTKVKIYVEDLLAQSLIETALEDIDSAVSNNYSVIPYPGGADTIVKQLPVLLAVTNDTSQDIALLDGDKRKSVHARNQHNYRTEIQNGTLQVKRFSQDIAQSEYRNLDNILTKQTGVNGSKFPLPLNGGNASNVTQAIDLKLSILNKYHEKFHFMNTDTPEELIWEIADGTLPNIYKRTIIEADFKDKFKSACIEMNGVEETNSETILQLQKVFIRNRDKNHPKWVELLSTLKLSLNLIS
ncbi:ATP-binding protein [Vibrio lentus]|uniref:ATP-binding protein n=1 Tax=Vibrio lentus TaxID=136468 RepID=UPI000C860830|nr:ATP-binding protein [Vibrio lentus]PMI90146.1 hypothetical protein BCU35_04810 [Vibrio lentus]